MKCKKTVSTVFSVSLFIGCAVFVAYRGYGCFKKYLSVPEKVDISFKLTGTQNFPEITLCPFPAFNETVFDECKLDLQGFMNDATWVSMFNKNLTISSYQKHLLKAIF